MPELPEVETVRAGLAPALTNAIVESIEILDERSLRRHQGGVAEFVATLTGKKILAVVRRGKFLWMPLATESSPIALVGHLGMSGQMLLRDQGAPADKLTRVVLHCRQADGQVIEMRFIDQRLFGGLQLDSLVETQDSKSGGFSAGIAQGTFYENLIPVCAKHIARDPLDADFDVNSVIAKLRKKNSGIKRILLDQAVVSGIGNIYADETLWRSSLHYDTLGREISGSKAKEMFAHVEQILRDAVAVGGTSFDEQYKNVNGESGYFEISLNAYGRKGNPCARCGTLIVREEWANRGSHFCPKCQRRK